MFDNPQFFAMIKNLATPRGTYRAGYLYALDDATANEWVTKGMAVWSDDRPEYVLKLLARLDDGAGKPCIFAPPIASEFGHLILSHIRLVHFHKASEKVVCCRPCQEVLYPSATTIVTDWTDPTPDTKRLGSSREHQPDECPEWPMILARYPDHHVVSYAGLDQDQELWAIEPMQPIPFRPKRRGLRADVLFGVRNRTMAPEKNWPHWGRIAAAAQSAGLSFAVIGTRDTSLDLPGQLHHSGDYDTDAAIELMENCRLYVGSDTGSAHLAATVGCPMLIFRPHDRVSRDFVHRMEQINPSPVELLKGGWIQPARVAERMVELASVEKREPASRETGSGPVKRNALIGPPVADCSAAVK